MIVGMDLIDELLKTTLYSAYLKDEKPLSLILAAPPEHFKTASLMTLEGNQAVLVTSFTPFGFIRDYYSKLKEGRLKYILIPDMFALFQSKYIRNDVIGLLLDLLEHGTLNISKYRNRGTPDIIEKVKLGVIMATTPKFLEDGRHRWMYENGFLSRFLIISYQYDDILLGEIHDAVEKERTKIERKNLDIQKEEMEVRCQPRFIKKLKPLLSQTQKAQDSRGIRLREHVRCLLKANSFKHNRTEVNDEDVLEVGVFLKYANLEKNPIKPFEMVKKEVKKELRI